jgi:putative restriction endonuclease
LNASFALEDAPPVLKDVDDLFREHAIAYVNAVADRAGGVVRRDELESFEFRGTRVRLIAPRQGIWKPATFNAALSFVTTFTPQTERPPYDDDIGEDSYPRYKWRGTDPLHHDNVALRRAMELGKPLLWFVGVAPGIYEPHAPVWLVHEEPVDHQFVVAIDEPARSWWRPGLESAPVFDPVRRYAQVLVQQRLHQRLFRSRVLVAYQQQCALCRLRHPRLLDAAHIRTDAQGGEPVVTNGLAMCAIHHRAFDADVLTVTPKYRIEISPRVLKEHDGPTLQYALQGLHGESITLPRHRAEHPDRDLLEERLERFRAAV